MKLSTETFACFLVLLASSQVCALHQKFKPLRIPLAPTPQILIALVERMPNMPSPFAPPDWKARAHEYTAMVFDPVSQGPFKPLMWWDDSRLDINQTTFGMPSYVGSTFSGGPHHEAINTMAAVLTGLLSGHPMQNLSGPGFANVDFVAMLNNYFDVTHKAFVWKNTVDGNGNSEFWYQVWISMLPLLVSCAAGEPTALDANIRTAAASWFAAEQSLGGSASSLPNFNFSGYDFIAHKGVLNGQFTQPAAAAGIAFLLYATRARFGDDAQDSLLMGARWALDYMEACQYDVFWEVLVPFGALTAARMNAELGTHYDVDRLINWVLQDSQTPPRPPFRYGWGTFAGVAWGGLDVSGLVGSVTDNSGYAFAMDTFVALAAMLPIARYNPGYARGLGKWALNVINAARLFYPCALAPSNQSDAAWALANDPGCTIAYEGLRCFGPERQLQSPYGTGDAKAAGSSGTNLALYGASYVGLLATLATPTAQAGVYELDLLATDWAHAPADPSFLYYNPGTEVQLAVRVRARAGVDKVDAWDRVSGAVLGRGLVPGSSLAVTVAADAACLLVFVAQSPEP